MMELVWQKFMETGRCASSAKSGRPKKIILGEDRMLKWFVQLQGFMSLGIVNRAWNDRISKVGSQSTARGRMHRILEKMYSKNVKNSPLRYTIFSGYITFFR